MIRQRRAHGVEEVVCLAEDARLEAALEHRRVQALQQARVGQHVGVIHDMVRRRQPGIARRVLRAEGGPRGAATAAAGAGRRQHRHRVRVGGDLDVAVAVAVCVAVHVVVAA